MVASWANGIGVPPDPPLAYGNSIGPKSAQSKAKPTKPNLFLGLMYFLITISKGKLYRQIELDGDILS